jgi:hypothetical protein
MDGCLFTLYFTYGKPDPPICVLAYILKNKFRLMGKLLKFGLIVVLIVVIIAVLIVGGILDLIF